MAQPNVNLYSGVGGQNITLSDSTEYQPTRAVWVGGAGNLAVVLASQTSPVIFYSVPAGTFLPLEVTKFMSTDTTASNVTAVW